MSEHISINGKCNYLHSPYNEEGAFTYCKNCKETCSKVIVELHEGWFDDWICLRCSKCKKSIWTSKLKRKITTDNKKCYICNNPTNWIDCFCSQVTLEPHSKTKYFCSNKCDKKFEKREEKERKELRYKKVKEMFEELGACAIEQGYSITMEDKIYLDISIILLLKKILKEELNITDKEFEEIRIYGNR